ncbi:hypothetical protein F2Q70_00016643 [Brassica cretica]|uniref:Uncharacterized protein n=1 Tax=Brassica cretica TaxID=69181 RepID=A0A8S9KRP6_BRACR|nr:hypothetical protein F2Q70_00016643 [Brassica cretica]KAF2596752.1 hypothetical protein F2Q68_00009609 [Brassica cretica]
MALTVLCGSTEEHVPFVVVSARSMVWWICRRFRGPDGSSELMAFARYLRTVSRWPETSLVIHHA